MTDLVDYLGLSGVVAIIAGIFGYGGLHQRVTHLNERTKNLERADRSAENAIAIARLEEQFTAIREDIREIKQAVVRPDPTH